MLLQSTNGKDFIVGENEVPQNKKLWKRHGSASFASGKIMLGLCVRYVTSASANRAQEITNAWLTFYRMLGSYIKWFCTWCVACSTSSLAGLPVISALTELQLNSILVEPPLVEVLQTGPREVTV